jgi:folate-binding protein YgfZ
MADDVMLGNQVEREAALREVALIEFPLFGCIEVRGADRLDLLHRLSTNNLLAAKRGEVIPTVFTTDKGRIVDFVRVIVGDALLLLVSLGNEDRFVRWIEKYTIMEDVQLTVRTESTAMLTFIGPEAARFISEAIEAHLEPNRAVEKTFQFGEATICFRDEFGKHFVDILTSRENAPYLLQLLHCERMRKVSREGYETFRIAQGIPHHGRELTEAYNPYDVGLKFAISYTKGCYIGQEVIARLDTYGKVQKALVGITFTERGDAVEAGAAVVLNGTEIGTITSLSPSAVRGRRVGLAVLKKNALGADNHVSIVLSGTTLEGIVVPLPIELLSVGDV